MSIKSINKGVPFNNLKRKNILLNPKCAKPNELFIGAKRVFYMKKLRF